MIINICISTSLHREKYGLQSRIVTSRFWINGFLLPSPLNLDPHLWDRVGEGFTSPSLVGGGLWQMNALLNPTPTHSHPQPPPEPASGFTPTCCAHTNKKV